MSDKLLFTGLKQSMAHSRVQVVRWWKGALRPRDMRGPLNLVLEKKRLQVLVLVVRHKGRLKRSRTRV